MKRHLYIFLIILSNQALALNHASRILIYDSSQNFLGKHPEGYIGQKLYLKPLNDDLKQFGYTGFIQDYRIDKEVHENIYYPMGQENRTQYDRMAGKYFQVTDVISPLPDSANYGGDDDYIFKLVNLSNNDTLYYIYVSSEEHRFPFMVDGYYQKQKKQAVGKKYVFNNNYIFSCVDVDKGTLIVVKTGEVWTCVDVKMDDVFFPLALIFKNKGGDKIAVDATTTLGEQRTGKALYKAEADKYKLKFGEAKFNNLLKGIYSVGDTKEMCLIAGVQTRGITKKTVGKNNIEIWTLMSGKLTFENGKLTKIE